MELGVLSEGMTEILELALVELQLSTFEEWMWPNRGSILRARRSESGSDREKSSGSGDATPSPHGAGNE